MRAMIEAFARNSVFSTVAMIIIYVGGILAGTAVVRERFPSTTINLVTVLVPYPGAAPEEVEEAICTKVEEAINGIRGIKEYNSKSFENYGMVYIEVLENYDTNLVCQEVTSRVNAIPGLPADAEKPIITRPVLPDEVIQIGLSGALDERRMKEWAEDVKRDLQAMPEISQIEVVGAREYEIAIEVSEERLREYGLTFDQVAMAVRANSQSLAGGTLRTEGEQIRLRTVGRKYWGDEFSNIEVMGGPRGEVVTLGKVAKITDGFTEDYVSARLNGEAAIVLRVYKTDSEDAITIAKCVRDYVNAHQQALPQGMKMQVRHDLSEAIFISLDTLTENGIQGIIIVFLALWLLLDLRLGIWATNGVPISICGTLILLWLTGNTINLVSLFALLLATGMVVDDAIVMGEAIYTRRENGEGAVEAAVNATMEMGVPILASGATMLIGFAPLFYVGGFMGKLIWMLPFVLFCTLGISVFENFFMLPAHLAHLPDFKSAEYKKRMQRNPLYHLRQGINQGFEFMVARLYMPVLEWIIRNRYVTLALFTAVTFCAVGLILGGFVKFIMFPPIDSFFLNGTVEFPSGTPIEVTQAAVKRMEDAIYRVQEKMPTASGEPLIQDLFSISGQEMNPLPGQKAALGSHLGGVVVEILKNPARGYDSDRIVTAWEKELGTIPGIASLRLRGDDSGPPGKPLEICLQGKDMKMLAQAADSVKTELDELDGVSQVESDFRPGKNEIHFELKPSARVLGLTVADLARQVYSGFFGTEALRLQRGRDDIHVRVRYPREERSSLAKLYQVRIRTPFGSEVPLRSVANISYEPGFTQITRIGGMRCITVSADLDGNKLSATEVLAHLNESGGLFEKIKRQHNGLSIDIRGEQKNSQESLRPLMYGFPLALVAIYFIIALTFSSHIQTILIILTIPFAFVGAIFGHYLWGCPITMFSIFGVVGLAGVVVNGGIIVIEGFNMYIAEGALHFDAVRQTVQRRFRAAFLVVVTDIFGTLPMILETERQVQFIIPMVVAYCAGLLASAALSMLLLPALLIVINDLRCAFRWLRTGVWPEREEVEPASSRFLGAQEGVTFTHAYAQALAQTDSHPISGDD